MELSHDLSFGAYTDTVKVVIEANLAQEKLTSRVRGQLLKLSFLVTNKYLELLGANLSEKQMYTHEWAHIFFKSGELSPDITQVEDIATCATFTLVTILRVLV